MRLCSQDFLIANGWYRCPRKLAKALSQSSHDGQRILSNSSWCRKRECITSGQRRQKIDAVKPVVVVLVEDNLRFQKLVSQALANQKWQQAQNEQ
jgi:hypothetical protein